MAYNPLNPNGQAQMANSQPIVIASDQSPVSVTGTVAISNFATNQSISGIVGASIIGIPTIQTGNTSVIALIQGSVATVSTPVANQSVSGRVEAVIIGAPSVYGNISGSVVAFQGAGWSGSVAAIVTNTITINPVSVAGTIGASIIGLPTFQTGNNSVISLIQGSVATVIIGGSIAASFTPPANQSVSGTVGANLISSNASVISVGQGSIATVIIGGSIAASFTPPANQSVSGTVGASIIGLPPVSISDGSQVLDLYEENQVDASVIGIAMMWKSNMSTSILSAVTPATPLPVSVQGVVGISGNPSISGTILVNNGSVVAFQGTNPWIMSSSIAGGIFPISGSVAAVVTNNVTVVSSIAGGIFPISGSVAAVITNTPNVNTAGSVVAFQGTSPWVVNFQNSSILAVPVGSIIALNIGSIISTQIGSVISVIQGSVAAFQGGTTISSISGTVVVQSIVGTYAEDAASTSADPGLFVLGVRNDTIASLVSANGDYGAFANDSAGRQIVKPFVSEDATVISYVGSVVSGSVTLIQASAIGKRNYITDFWVTNSGSVATLITFQGGDTSIVGYTIAPAGGGSNSPGIAVPLRNTASQDLAFKSGTSVSILYMTVKGYQAP